MNSQSSRNKTYFISDLHLDPSRPSLFKLFDEFIQKITPDVEALYILGDLFEFWIGDDIIDLPMGKPYLPVINQLKKLSDSGVKIFFIQGNRDFLIGDKFMQSIGGKLLPDECVIDLYGESVLIMHGDTLCTDDKGYQLMRKIFRLRIIQKIYLSMSPEKRSQKAGQVRKTTSENNKQKTSMILDVNQHAVEKSLSRANSETMSEYNEDSPKGEVTIQENKKPHKSGGVSFLIHGHTHRPAEHDVTINSQINKRIVLGDWGDQWSYLEWSKNSDFRLCF